MRDILFFCLLFFGGWYSVFAQCSQPLNSGHLFLSPTSGCTPHTVEIKNLYANSTADTEYRIDWGDGTTETLMGSLDPVDGGAFDPIYTPDFSHTYLLSTTQCGYDILIEAVNECTLAEDARLELTVSIWDTDEIGLMINPGIIRICQGYAADVNFQDASDWNCYPRSVRQNDPPREIQWEYTGGTLSGISIPTLGVVPVTGPIESVMNPGRYSLTIPVPAEDPLNPGNPYPIGAFFDVRLNNWNRCNPRSAGNDPVTDLARILIVESPDPDFITKKEDVNQPPQTVFCVGDPVFFDNLSSGPPGANLDYIWEFFNDTLSSTLPFATTDQVNPLMTFDQAGIKKIHLTITDRNAIGNCEKTIEKMIEITPSPQPLFSILDEEGSPADTRFCVDSIAGISVGYQFVNVSTDTTDYTSWQWEILDRQGQLILQEPTGGLMNSAHMPLIYNFEEAGQYRIRLYAEDDITGCSGVFEDTVQLIPSPDIAVSAEPVCEGSPSVLNNSITPVNEIDSLFLLEWDFDSGTGSMIADTVIISSGIDTIQYFYPSSGTFTARLKAVGQQSNCTNQKATEVIVDKVPEFTFIPSTESGCSPLDVSIPYPFPGDTSMVSSFEWLRKTDEAGWDTIWVSADTLTANSEFTLSIENVNNESLVIPIGLSVEYVTGCRSVTEFDTLTVFPVLKTGFTALDYDPLSPNCSPLPVQFKIDEATHSTEPLRYTWEIRRGDQLVSDTVIDGAYPQYDFLFTNQSRSALHYSVLARAVHEEYCYEDSILRILINPVPSSEFNIDTVRLDCEEMEIEIRALQSGLPEYLWILRENSEEYIQAGSEAEVKLTRTRPEPARSNLDIGIELITANQSYCYSDTSDGTVSVPSKVMMNPFFKADPEEQVMPDHTVQITNYTEPGSFTTEWDFGDGNTTQSTEPGPHQYPGPGTYTIILTLSDGYCEEIYQQDIRILPIPPVVDFTYRPGEGCPPLVVTFENLSENVNPSSFVWDFSDQQGLTTLRDPTHTFYKPGKYTVSLRASNNYGDTVEIVKKEIIAVFENPVADFTVRPTRAYAGEMIYTTNHSTNGTEYFWDFGDQHFSNEFEPVHSYSVPGSYDITLYIETEKGCEDSFSLTSAVDVEEGGRVKIPNAFSPDTSGPNGGHINASGKNDVFYPITEGVRSLKMYVFNKWGEVLFYSEDINFGWDGYYKGQLCPQDVYVYKLELEYVNGEEEIKVGDVNLLR